MQETIISIISNALMEDVNLESTVENLAGWDSLGHLSILTALDEASSGRISEIKEFNNVKSVSEIIHLCELYKIEFSSLR